MDNRICWWWWKSKGIPRQAEVAQGVPGKLRPRIFSTFSTTRVVGHQPNAPAAFTPGEIPGTHFQRLSQPQGTRFCQKEPRKKSHVTPPGIDPGTVRLVARRLNHYAIPGPCWLISNYNICFKCHKHVSVCTFPQKKKLLSNVISENVYNSYKIPLFTQIGYQLLIQNENQKRCINLKKNGAALPYIVCKGKVKSVRLF
jgi:hypothetical protein